MIDRYLDVLGVLREYVSFPEMTDESVERSLRFGTFGPPSNEPGAYLMSTLGMVDIGDTAQSIDFAVSHPVYHGEQKHFFRAKETFYGPVVVCETLGHCWYPDDTPEAEVQTPRLGIFHVSIHAEELSDRCLAFGRAALDRYLAFLFLHRESDAWSHGEAFGLWLGRTMGRAEMRERAAEVAERCSGGDADLSQRDLIAAKIRALEVWQ